MTTPKPGLPACPYKGLIPYGEEDASFFFGRDAERRLIVANLKAYRLTLLYGGSGVGKSSLLRAGVIPDLRERNPRGRRSSALAQHAVVAYGVSSEDSWRDDPVPALIFRLMSAAAAGTRQRSPSRRRSLIEALYACARERSVFVVLDQFEEYFLYHCDDGPGSFGAEFVEAIARSDLRVNFLISMRDDALARLDRFKGQLPQVFDNRLQVEHLSRSAARLAIESPLSEYSRLAGESYTIEPELVDAVLAEVETGKVLLGGAGRGTVTPAEVPPHLDETRIEAPFLQLVMTRLWQEDHGARQLRLATLRRLKGAPSIVHTHLEGVMRRLTVAQREIVARAFHHLVTPSGTKIALRVDDLAQYAESPRADLNDVLTLLSGDARVLRKIDPPVEHPEGPRYEIFHDVLARAVLDWQARYADAKQWRETRPWGWAHVLSTARLLPFKNDVASIGRSVDWWRHQLDLRAQEVSRVQLLISRDLMAVDLRGKYGTTINGKFLTYGTPQHLQDGDLVVLSGVAALRIGALTYPEFDGSIAAPLNPPPEVPAPIEGWGLLIDGKARIWWSLSGARYFLSLDAAQRIEVLPRRRQGAFMTVVVDEAGLLTLEALDHEQSMTVTVKMAYVDYPVVLTVAPGEALPPLAGYVRIDRPSGTVDFRGFGDFADPDEAEQQGYKEYLAPVYGYRDAWIQILPVRRDLDPDSEPDDHAVP